MSLYNLALSFGTLLIMATCFGRLNEIGKDKTGPIWWVRKISLVILIGACAMVFASPATENVPHWSQLVRVMFIWGMAGALLTSPNQKPWWHLFTGHFRTADMTRRQRFGADIAAIKYGFTREAPARRMGDHEAKDVHQSPGALQ